MTTMLHISPDLENHFFLLQHTHFCPQFEFMVWHAVANVIAFGFCNGLVPHSIAIRTRALVSPPLPSSVALNQPKANKHDRTHILWVFMCMRLRTWFCVPHIYANPVFTIFACTLFFGRSNFFRFFFSANSKRLSLSLSAPAIAVFAGNVVRHSLVFFLWVPSW